MLELSSPRGNCARVFKPRDDDWMLLSPSIEQATLSNVPQIAGRCRDPLILAGNFEGFEGYSGSIFIFVKNLWSAHRLMP